MTAAHYITNSQVDQVVLGQHDMRKNDDITKCNGRSGEYVTVQKSVVHPSFGVVHSHTLYMNFGLLFLDNPSNRPPIKFLNEDHARPVVGEIVAAVGWVIINFDNLQNCKYDQ